MLRVEEPAGEVVGSGAIKAGQRLAEGIVDATDET